MGFETPEKSWIEFARKNRADAKFHAQAGRRTDACWTISKEAEYEINFIWGVQPIRERLEVTKRTDYFFSLNSDSNFSFEMYANDFFTRMALVFNSKKIKIGNDELDSKYVFISNDKQLAQSFVGSLKSFVSRNKEMNFLIMTEVGGMKNEEKRLLIQVNELLKEEQSIELFFNLGMELQKAINGKF